MSAACLTEESVQVEGLEQNDEALTEVAGELETDFQPENEESPPDYNSLASPLSVTAGDSAGEEYLAHLEFVADSVGRQERSSTLIGEAPPSYKQLFGNGEVGTETSNKERAGQARRHSQSRRPHTRPRRTSHGTDRGSGGGGGDTDILSQLSKKFSSIKTATLGLVGFLAALFSLSLAMVIVGGLNINTCQSIVVPVYLMVAGFIQLSSLLFQTIACIAEKCGVEKCGTIRVCDLFGFALFIWLVIGSNWIVRIGWRRSSNCKDFITDYVSMAINSTMPDSDYEVPEIDGGDDMCGDCASSVYLFTSVVIVLQYIMVILVCMSCCSVLYRSRSSHHHSRPRHRH